MSEYREVLRKVLVDGTPDRCVGCHSPFLKADHLTEQVLSGAMEAEEATTKLREDLEQSCRYGRAAIRSANGLTDQCMYAQTPTLAGMESYPASLRNWDEFESVRNPGLDES